MQILVIGSHLGEIHAAIQLHPGTEALSGDVQDTLNYYNQKGTILTVDDHRYEGKESLIKLIEELNGD